MVEIVRSVRLRATALYATEQQSKNTKFVKTFVQIEVVLRFCLN